MQEDHYQEAELGVRAFGLCSDAQTLLELLNVAHRDRAREIRTQLQEARAALEALITNIKELEYAN